MHDALNGTDTNTGLRRDLLDAFALRRAARIRSSTRSGVRGRPRVLPCVRARSSPALTRSRIIARSNAANSHMMDCRG